MRGAKIGQITPGIGTRVYKGVLAVLGTHLPRSALEPKNTPCGNASLWRPQKVVLPSGSHAKNTFCYGISSHIDLADTWRGSRALTAVTRLQLVQPAACNWRAPLDASVQQGCGAVLHRLHAVEVSSSS